MAGYSGTPLPKKLGIKDGARVAFVDAYEGFADTLGGLPPGVTVVTRDQDNIDVIVCFATEPLALQAGIAQLKPRLAYTGGLWVCWPKRASGMATSLTEDIVRGAGLAAGLVDNKVCAIDERWSGLRFVYRLADRPAAMAGT